jgi:hypothetical protein
MEHRVGRTTFQEKLSLRALREGKSAEKTTDMDELGKTYIGLE